MEVKFFKTPVQFNKWLQKNGEKKPEIWIGFYKKDSSKKAMTYIEAIDEALCFGWIDGIRKKVDDISYTNRFTPRKKHSNWSNVNTNKIKALIEQGRVKPAGMKAYEAKDEKRSGIYSFENKEQKLSATYLKQFKQNKKAWNYFTAKAPWYQRTCIHLVMNAKTEATTLKRLAELIKYSANETTIPQLTRNPK